MSRRKELSEFAASWWTKQLEANSISFSEALAGLIEEELEDKKTVSINCSTKRADPLIRMAAKATQTKLVLKELTMVVSTNPKVGVLVSDNGFSRIHN